MNERIKELALKSGFAHEPNKDQLWVSGSTELMISPGLEKFAELIVRECAKELREAEREADRAFQTRELKERSKFDGYDFADMLEERFGVV